MLLFGSLTSNDIKKSFKSCALNLSTDGLDNVVIQCVKSDQPCKSAKEILVSQLLMLNERMKIRLLI